MIREFRKLRNSTRIFPKNVRKKRVVFFGLLSLFFFLAGNIRSDETKSFQENFKSFLEEFQKHPSASLVRSFQTQYSSFEPEPCAFEESGRFEKVIYLSYKCKEKTWSGFIYLGGGSEFWKNRSAKISLGEVLKIGKKVYLEVKPSFEGEHSSPDFKKHGKKDHAKKEPQTPKEYKDNYGLQYYLSIAKHPAKRDLNGGKEIFFDSSCPLIFLKKDSDFYWEKAVYYSFQASCIPSSPYSYIRIRSDLLGKIRVDDKDTDNVQEGAKYLGKLKIHSIEADKILWRQDAEIYNE
ncbi:hypothetical protein LEP1GSC193_0488 [Leptospira alstonii serovar Pingchang str. 80-412]|uniref:Uncharacterized protein n=2 Tax=Leptospira alstonii TaxID=28452 RepID=M6CKX4_9LEPT|nr:hypothetical protein [Leptospira alstonii]EMJ92572.1 hypothetical protein LEP1GSC194_0688 [Leptospira alstonii serovar Sichuan str. 79601]EQA79600.1 hypothetical protein LEP1GSC193_0488 [Leptospira alstonii serovar Pingchang str. 80-412]